MIRNFTIRKLTAVWQNGGGVIIHHWNRPMDLLLVGPKPQLRRHLLSTHTSTTFPTVPICEVQLIMNKDDDDEQTTENNNADQQFADALRPYYDKQTPVIFRKSALHYPAIKKWKDLSYLETQLEDWKECHVEMGLYNNPKEGERLCIPFFGYAQYLKLLTIMEQDKNNPRFKDDPPPLIYLAQNELPSKIEHDIHIPGVCCSSTTDTNYNMGHGRLYQRNLWIGPANVASPLHYDPLDNFIMQIVGKKRVFLLDKTVDPEWLYAGEQHNQQYNTSAVPVHTGVVDEMQYPKFQNVLDQYKILSSELNTGDILFIPSKWWHALVALEYSISVNVWWR